MAHPEAEATLLRLLTLLAHNIAAELAERLAAAGFGDQRLAHHAVFANVPAEGIRLTALAQRAGESKQAMSELVASLEERHYVRRVPDPRDGRARLIAFNTTRRRSSRRGALGIPRHRGATR